MQNIDVSKCDKIVQKLENIFLKRFNVMLNKQEDTFRDKHLLGNDVGFSARDLLYLYNDIETEFSIKIPQDVIAEGKFSSFNNIVDIIYNVTKIAGEVED